MTIIKDVHTIRDTAIEIFQEVAADRSVDEFLCHPKEALDLCRRVREKLGKRISDEDICRTLLNARKQGKVK